MNEVNRLHWAWVLLLALIFVASCSNQSNIVGLWQSAGDAGTLEFKVTGEITVVDNMSATMVGRFVIEGDSLTFELTGSDILRESVQPIPTIVLKADFDLQGDELILHLNGEDETEIYRRVR